DQLNRAVATVTLHLNSAMQELGACCIALVEPRIER
ncbi:hypothetical protein Pgy4_41239, partial [Pseudomonas savastanoi pv. glycinea str. race 4]